MPAPSFRVAALRVALRWLEAKGAAKPSYKKYVERKKQEGKQPLDKDAWSRMVGETLADIKSEVKKPKSEKPAAPTPPGSSKAPISTPAAAESYLKEFLTDESKAKVDAIMKAFESEHQGKAKAAKRADKAIRAFREDYEAAEKAHEANITGIRDGYAASTKQAKKDYETFAKDATAEWSAGKITKAEMQKRLDDAKAEVERKNKAMQAEAKKKIQDAKKAHKAAQATSLDRLQIDVENAFDPQFGDEDEDEDDKKKTKGKKAALRVASRWLLRA